jgi:putative polyhydroxyalkanoate system protein
MPKIVRKVAHNTTAADAKAKLEPLEKQLRDAGATVTWRDTQTAEIKSSLGVSGTLVITDETIAIDLDLKMPASFMQKTIESNIDGKIKTIFG